MLLLFCASVQSENLFVFLMKEIVASIDDDTIFGVSKQKKSHKGLSSRSIFKMLRMTYGNSFSK